MTGVVAHAICYPVCGTQVDTTGGAGRVGRHTQGGRARRVGRTRGGARGAVEAGEVYGSVAGWPSAIHNHHHRVGRCGGEGQHNTLIHRGSDAGRREDPQLPVATGSRGGRDGVGGASSIQLELLPGGEPQAAVGRGGNRDHLERTRSRDRGCDGVALIRIVIRLVLEVHRGLADGVHIGG